jgi:hypothetical protein
MHLEVKSIGCQLDQASKDNLFLICFRYQNKLGFKIRDLDKNVTHERGVRKKVKCQKSVRYYLNGHLTFFK